MTTKQSDRMTLHHKIVTSDQHLGHLSACKPGLLLDFDGALVGDKSGKNIYVASKNINTRKGSGRFVGNSVITVYRYSHAELGQSVSDS